MWPMLESVAASWGVGAHDEHEVLEPLWRPRGTAQLPHEVRDSRRAGTLSPAPPLQLQHRAAGQQRIASCVRAQVAGSKGRWGRLAVHGSACWTSQLGSGVPLQNKLLVLQRDPFVLIQ